MFCHENNIDEKLTTTVMFIVAVTKKKILLDGVQGVNKKWSKYQACLDMSPIKVYQSAWKGLKRLTCVHVSICNRTLFLDTL